MQVSLAYEVVKTDGDSAWAVEAINHDGEGEVFRSLFLGNDAESRAREYAEWKNRQSGEVAA